MHRLLNLSLCSWFTGEATPHVTMSKIISLIGLDHNFYSVHSFRVGRLTYLLKFGLSVETIKKLGHRKSNAVFRYLH